MNSASYRKAAALVAMAAALSPDYLGSMASTPAQEPKEKVFTEADEARIAKAEAKRERKKKR